MVCRVHWLASHTNNPNLGLTTPPLLGFMRLPQQGGGVLIQDRIYKHAQILAQTRTLEHTNIHKFSSINKEGGRVMNTMSGSFNGRQGPLACIAHKCMHPGLAWAYFEVLLPTNFQNMDSSTNWPPKTPQAQKHWQIRRLGDLNAMDHVPEQDWAKNLDFALPSKSRGNKVLLHVLELSAQQGPHP